MDKQNVIYMTPKEIKNIEPSSIDTMTMTSGTLIKIAKQEGTDKFQEEKIESNVPICERCGLPKYASNTAQNVFRAKPQGETQEEQQEVVVEGEEAEEQKEVLRGPNGMPLLGEIISGGNLPDQNNYYNHNTNGPIQTPTVPINPPSQPPIVQPPNVLPNMPAQTEPEPIIPKIPAQAPIPSKPSVVPQGQRPFQPPQTIHPPLPKPMYPPQQNYIPPPMNRPTMPAGRGS